jgi:hypothetical protein
MASGFSLSEMGTEGGCFMNAVGAGTGAGADAGAGGAGAFRGGASLRGRSRTSGRSAGTGASCATVAVGVMGDTGGRSEVGDSERFDVVEVSLEDAGRKSVFTSSAGMVAVVEGAGAAHGNEAGGAGTARPEGAARGGDAALLSCALRPWSEGAWVRDSVRSLRMAMGLWRRRSRCGLRRNS